VQVPEIPLQQAQQVGFEKVLLGSGPIGAMEFNNVFIRATLLEPLSLSAAAQALRGVGLEADVPILSGRVGEALIFKRRVRTG